MVEQLKYRKDEDHTELRKLRKSKSIPGLPGMYTPMISQTLFEAGEKLDGMGAIFIGLFDSKFFRMNYSTFVTYGTKAQQKLQSKMVKLN